MPILSTQCTPITYLHSFFGALFIYPVPILSTQGVYFIHPVPILSTQGVYFIYPGCLIYLHSVSYLFAQCVIFIYPVPSTLALALALALTLALALAAAGGGGVLFFLIIKSFKCLKFARQGFDLSPERRCTSPCSIASTSTCPPPSPSHLPSLSFVCLASHSKTTTTTIIIRVRRTFFPPSIVPETLGPCSCDPGNSVP